MLIKVFNSQRNDWDVRVPAALWAYKPTFKNLIVQTPFRLVYGKEEVILIKFIVPILRVALIIGISEFGAVEERLSQLL